MALVLKYATGAQLADRYWTHLQDAYSTGDKLAYGRLLWWLEERLLAGDLTDTQARNTFNTAFGRSLTAGQWTTLRTSRIQPAHDRYAALLAEGAL